MKIAFYMTTVLEFGGGIEKFLIEAAASLSRYPNASVDIITMDNQFTDRINHALSIFFFKKIDKKYVYKEDLKDIERRLGEATYYKAQTIRELRRQLQKYDVIYSKNELIESFILKFLVGYKTIPPVIFGGHTALHYPNPQSSYARLHNYLYSSGVYRFLASGVSRFHALNDFEASLYKRMFPTRQVAKIYNPFDITAFRKTAKKYIYPRSTEFSSNLINILWVGRLSEQKGVQDLSQIISIVNHKTANKFPVSWNICGDGDLRYLVNQITEQETNVHYFGHVDQKYMANIYQRCQVFITTSKWESFGYTALEPQAFGLEIFAYDIPGLREVLGDYRGTHFAKNINEMIESLTENLEKYNSNGYVPKNEPSDQFAPSLIYGQLLNLLNANDEA